MAFARMYGDCLSGMKKLLKPEHGVKTKLTLVGRQYPGTKVRPFKTFGVTASLTIDGKHYMGTGVAPMATSGGLREPKAVGVDLAKKHLGQLQQWLSKDNIDLLNPMAVDNSLLALDKTLGKERGLENPRPTSGIGSEVGIATTVAILEAQAAYFHIPTALAIRAILLHLQGKEPNIDGLVTPLPKFNILNFGKHSGSKRKDGKPHVWLQETKVAPIGAKNFQEAVFAGIEVLNNIIDLAGVDNVGFEAGISPALTSPEEVYEMSKKAIEKAGLASSVVIAADAAASEFSNPVSEGSDKYQYHLYPGKAPLDAQEMVKFWVDMVDKYQLISIEDGMNSEDTVGWEILMAALGNRVEIQGDDLLVTDAEETKRLAKCANSILIKPNQAGTMVRTLKTIAAARELDYTISPSHRSGKVPGGYGMIPELCLGTEAEWIKPGAPRRERQGFLNNVMSLTDELTLLGVDIGYAGGRVAKKFAVEI